MGGGVRWAVRGHGGGRIRGRRGRALTHMKGRTTCFAMNVRFFSSERARMTNEDGYRAICQEDSPFF